LASILLAQRVCGSCLVELSIYKHLLSLNIDALHHLSRLGTALLSFDGEVLHREFDILKMQPTGMLREGKVQMSEDVERRS